MTSGGEIRKSLEATRPTTLLSTRKINIGSWNVRTMYETGKTSSRDEKIQLDHFRN